MKNFVQEGDRLFLPVPSGKVSGDAVLVGDIACVCLTSRDADGKATVATKGVFSLPVTAAGALAIGTALYHDGTVINDVDTDTLYGYLLTTVAGAGVVTVDVKLKG